MAPRARRPRLAIGAALLFTLGIVLAACSGQGGTTPPPSASLLPRTPAALPTYDLATFRSLLRQLRGRPVVVNVWASWCGPCIVEGPNLARVQRRFAGRVQFLGVDSQDQPGPARAYIARNRWAFPSVFDPGASIMNGLGFIAQPVTQVYAADGSKVPRAFWASAVPERDLVAVLTRLTSST